MDQAEHFDVVVLGSGPGGVLLAWHLAASGQRVVTVERRYIGGSCPNIACMPSKNEIWSARIAYLVRNAAQFGTITGPVSTDVCSMIAFAVGIIRNTKKHPSKAWSGRVQPVSENLRPA